MLAAIRSQNAATSPESGLRRAEIVIAGAAVLWSC